MFGRNSAWGVSLGSNRTLSMPHRIWIVRVADPSNGDAIRIFGTFRQENVAWRALICLWKSHHGVEGHDPASMDVTIRELMDSGYEHLQIIETIAFSPRSRPILPLARASRNHVENGGLDNEDDDDDVVSFRRRFCNVQN